VKYEKDDCMYKFRTKKCCDSKCKKGKACFDYHSKDLARRVPKQIPTRGNLFNYIPQACPYYKKQKKCPMGNSCHLAHGWLEIIYHPLLFMTKLCECSLKKGVCRKYGIYCTKAHNENEIRNLVSIYGEDWKRHYQAHQACVSVKAVNKKVKLSKRVDVSDSSHSSGPTSKDHFPDVKSTGMNDFSSQMYGGSPLFVSTPPGRPFQSMGVCSDSVDGILRDQMASFDFSDFGHLTSMVSGEVGMYTKRCMKGENTVDSNRNKVQGTYSLFDDRFPWEFDWSGSKKDTMSKEPDSSFSGSDDHISNASKEASSCTSGSTHQMSSMTNQDTELLGVNGDRRFENANETGVTNRNNLPDDQVISRSLQDFDQQDWELKLREHGYEDERSSDSILIAWMDEFATLVVKMD